MKWLLGFLLLSAGAQANVAYGPQAFTETAGTSLTTAFYNYAISAQDAPSAVTAIDANLTPNTCASIVGVTGWDTAWYQGATYSYFDISATCDIGTATRVGLYTRTSGTWSAGWPSTGYLALYGAGNIYIYKFIAGSPSLLASAAYTPASTSNFTLEFVNSGSLLLVRVNGNFITSASDSAYTSGYFGLGTLAGTNHYTNVQVLSNQPPPATPVADPTPAPRNGYQTKPFMWFNAHGGVPGQTSLTVESDADGLISAGLKNYGWSGISIDAGWAWYRDDNGYQIPLVTTFGTSMLAISNYVHADGLTLNAYTDIGPVTCLNSGPGSFGYPSQDATVWAQDKFDGMAMDTCYYAGAAGTMQMNLQAAYNALQANGFPATFQIWGSGESGNPNYGYGSSMGANSWYSAEVNPATWANVVAQFALGYAVEQTSSIGPTIGWANFMELRTGEGMGTAQDQAQFDLWCMAHSPLLTFNVNPVSMTAATQGILENSGVIAVDQDTTDYIHQSSGTSGSQGVYYTKLAAANTYASYFLVTQSSGTYQTITFTSLGVASGLTFSVTNLDTGASLGNFYNAYSQYVSPTSGVMFLLSLLATPTPTGPSRVWTGTMTFLSPELR